MSHVALRDHGLDFCAQHFLQPPHEVDFEFVGILQDGRVEQDLVGLAESEVELVLVEQLFVGLQKLAPQNNNTELIRSHTFARLSFMLASVLV